MRQDVHIAVFGMISAPEAFRDLVKAAAEEGEIAWDGELDEDSAAEHLCGCTDGGTPFELTRRDTGNLFEAVTSACREHGLSYVVSTGDTGCEGFDNMACWRPGMDKPYETPCDDNDVHIRLSDLRQATKGGIDSVISFVEDIEAKTFAHTVPKRIEVSPEARVAWFAGAPAV